MTTPEIVLHQWCISPYCTKIRKVLAYKRLPYRIEEYGGLRALKVKSLSAAGKLPVLDYGGERIAESSKIAAFLDQRHPSPPLVPSSLDAALVHMLEDWADESLYWYELWLRQYEEGALDRAVAAACEGRPAWEHVLFKIGMGGHKKKVIAQGLGRYSYEQVIAKFHEQLAALEGRLTRQPWLAGDALSIADIAAAAQLDEVARTSALVRELDALPALAAWRKRCDFPAVEVGSEVDGVTSPVASA